MKIIYRIIATPLVFILCIIIVFGGLIFPTTVLMIISIFELFVQPFIWLINKGLDKKITRDFQLIEFSDNRNLNSLLGLTVLLWFPFYGAYLYWYKGELIFNTW